MKRLSAAPEGVGKFGGDEHAANRIARHFAPMHGARKGGVPALDAAVVRTRTGAELNKAISPLDHGPEEQ